MRIDPIKTERDYRTALREIEELMNARRGTARGARLDALVALIEVWEAKRHPFGGEAAV